MELVLLNRIEDNPYQPRRLYRDIPELALKIYDMRDNLPDTLGLIHVPTGRKVDGRVQLAEGHRRLRAFRQMFEEEGELDYMPVNILDLDDQAMDDIAWNENYGRSDLTPVEEARALKQTLETRGLTQHTLAQLRHMGRSSVTNKLRLLKLPEDVLDAIESEIISERHGMELLPALEMIGSPDLDMASDKLSSDIGFRIGSIFERPDPETLKRRLISPNTLPMLTSSDVRNVVEQIKRAVIEAKKQMREHQEWARRNQAAKEALDPPPTPATDVRARTGEPGSDTSQWLEPGPGESPPPLPVVEVSAHPAPDPPPPPPPPKPPAPADIHVSLTIKHADDLAGCPVMMSVNAGPGDLHTQQISYGLLEIALATVVNNHFGDDNNDDI